MGGTRVRRTLALLSAATITFLYVPLALIALYAFNDSRSVTWPMSGLTLRWLRQAAQNDGARAALALSVKVGLGAAAIALVLGTLLAFGVHRFRFYGRNAVSFLIVLPIALPGIITGVALNATFVNYLGGLAVWTVVVAHSTFCVVIVYNNVIARLRRTSASLEEASGDLGATAWQTFAFVTFPLLRSALLAGGLLAFALSFDEIIVTTFTLGQTSGETLPVWILSNISRPNQLPIVYAVALTVALISAVPVYIANRLAGDSAGGGRT
jgi:putative spermidine/putrescine transport system permease protein